MFRNKKEIYCRKYIKKICMGVAGILILMTMILGDPGYVYAISDNTSDTSSDSSNNENHDRYSLATSTNPFILPGNTWVTPVAKHGEYVYVVLPIVNMFKYNLQDVVVTPVISAKTDEWPFEIESTGYTEKIATLVGEDQAANPADRVQNCVWCFKTRDNVKTGYYKMEFSIVYTNPACVIETTTISSYVRTIGLPENGTTDGEDKDKKLSTPRLIVKGFSTDPGEVFSGSDFKLNITMENTSSETSVKNIQLDLTATVEGSTTQASYAAFLPASGSNSFYIDSIPANGTADLNMEFEAKAGLEQKPYVMTIAMKYEDEKANPYEGQGTVSIPVKQVSKYDTGSMEVEPSAISVGEQSDVMFNIYNTGKTTLYNVQVTVNDPAFEQALAFVGNLSPGATGNVDLMVTGAQVNEGETKLSISYEDESGKVTKDEIPISLQVSEASLDEGGFGEPGDLPEEPKAGMPVYLKVIIGLGSALIVTVVTLVIIKLAKRKRRKRDEEELEEYLDEDDR